jgi:hypothetical protein
MNNMARFDDLLGELIALSTAYRYPSYTAFLK